VNFGVSYFGCTHPRHFVSDFRHLRAAGLSFLVLPLSETDLWFNEGIVARQVSEARRSGLEVWLDPWGVCRIFGGESLSYFAARYPETAQRTRDGSPVPAACPNHPATRDFMLHWLNRASAIAPDGIFWDEPHFFVKTWHPENTPMRSCFCEQCDARARSLMDRSARDLPPDSLAAFQAQRLLSFILPLLQKTRDTGLKSALCLLPEELGGSLVLSQNPEIFATSVDFLSYDPYDHLLPLEDSAKRAFVTKYIDRLSLAKARWNLKTWLWLPGFLLPDGHEKLFPRTVETARTAGVDYLSLWSYRGTEMMSARASEKPEKAWRAFLRLVR
jgi:hypothetical protein